MSEPLNAAAVDQVIAQPNAARTDADRVAVPAAELVMLRERARVADSLETEVSASKIQLALSEALASTPFTDDVAALHAKQILASRVVVRADASGKMVAVDAISGRPAVDAIRDAVNGQEFKRYLRAGTTGGSPKPNAQSQPPDPGPNRRTYADEYMAARGGLAGIANPFAAGAAKRNN